MMKRFALLPRRIVTPDAVRTGVVHIADGTVTAVDGEVREDETLLDLSDYTLAPGVVELHAHGGNGEDFLSGDPAGVIRACRFHFSKGVTTICPTLTTAPVPILERALAAIRTAKESGACGARLVGAHVEGPYLSPAQSGAQAVGAIKTPDPAEYEDLIARYGDVIRRWTYAPELDDGRFAATLTAHGILPSAGHTNATDADIRRGIENGLSLVTHLYSCTSTVTRKGGFRSLGVVESAFLFDELSVELIADGKHLPDPLLQMILKIKGVDKTILVTDCLPITGTDLKKGSLAGVPFVVEDGVCKLEDRSAFAGSIATAETLLSTALRIGVSLPDAFRMLSKNPASLIGLDRVGAIDVGYDADLVLLREDLSVADTLSKRDFTENTASLCLKFAKGA